MKPSELVNGTGPPISSCLIDTMETEPPQKNKSNGRRWSDGLSEVMFASCRIQGCFFRF